MSSTPALASKPVNVPGKCAPLTPDLYLVQVNQEEGLCTSRDLALKAFDFLRTQHQDVSMFLVTSLKEAATLIGQKVIASLHSPEKCLLTDLESASNALENGRRSHPDAVILLSLHSEQALEFMEHGEFMGWKFNDGANA